MEDWNHLARNQAEFNNEFNFPSRRGVYAISVHGPQEEVLCVFNNNPYIDGARDEETECFREKMRAAGIQELGYATYPPEGESAGYSYAMILDAGEDRQQFVADAMYEAVSEVAQ